MEEKRRRKNEGFKILDEWQDLALKEIGRNAVLKNEEWSPHKDEKEVKEFAKKMVLGDGLANRTKDIQAKEKKIRNLMRLNEAKSPFILGLIAPTTKTETVTPIRESRNENKLDFKPSRPLTRNSKSVGRQQSFVQKNKQLTAYHPINEERIRLAETQFLESQCIRKRKSNQDLMKTRPSTTFSHVNSAMLG